MIRTSDSPANSRRGTSDIRIGIVTALPKEYAALVTFRVPARVRHAGNIAAHAPTRHRPELEG